MDPHQSINCKLIIYKPIIPDVWIEAAYPPFGCSLSRNRAVFVCGVKLICKVDCSVLVFMVFSPDLALGLSRGIWYIITWSSELS